MVSLVTLFGVRIFFGVKVGRAVGDILGVDWKEAFTVFTGVEGAMGVG